MLAAQMQALGADDVMQVALDDPERVGGTTRAFVARTVDSFSNKEDPR